MLTGYKMSNIAIKLTDISKKYILHHEKPTLTENILGRGCREEFWALKNINLKIKKGEKVGIIGSNGSGKTTLLKIINRITAPTAGEVQTSGKIVSLIELEAGFHPDLTGEENVYLNGLLLGMNRKETKRKFADIVKFADIGKFIDAPFYTYSDGMKLRLGFAIVVHTEPDILVLDETLAVGDQDFQKRSFAKIQEFFKMGKTIVLVSHNLKLIGQNCDRAIWLENGRIKNEGQAQKVIRQYQKEFK